MPRRSHAIARRQAEVHRAERSVAVFRLFSGVSPARVRSAQSEGTEPVEQDINRRSLAYVPGHSGRLHGYFAVLNH